MVGRRGFRPLTSSEFNKVKNITQESSVSHEECVALERAVDSHALVSRADSYGIITYANEKFCKTSQYTSAELIGNSHSIINSGYHHKSFFSEMWKTISTGSIWHGLVCNKKKDGSRYWVNSTICPIPVYDNNKNTTRYTYLSIRTEITDIALNEERFKRGQFFANIGTWDWHIETGKLYWSERVGYLFGYHESITEFSYAAFINSVHPDDKESVTTHLKACVEGTAIYDIEHRIVWPNGEIRWLHERGDVIRDVQGKAIQMLGITQDVTEKKQVELELQASKESAEKASVAKSIFLASMSHELRTPLNAIMGFAQVLQMDEDHSLTAEQSEYITEIYNAGGHLLNLISEVLNLAEIQSGKVNLNPQHVDLGVAISECITLCDSRLSSMKINLDVYLDNQLIECSSLKELRILVSADMKRLKQVLFNLLSNACKFNNEKGTIGINLVHDNEQIKVEIKDSGIGIKSELQDDIFQPFNRLGVEQTSIEGTGIGLLITKQLIEAMGGTLTFVSERGKGSTFCFTLPLEVSK